MNKRKYPDKFVVECPAYDFRWYVTYDSQEDSYLWVNSADGRDIGHFSTEAMDTHDRAHYKFIFPETPKEEPELVLPVVITASLNTIYSVDQGSDKDCVKLTLLSSNKNFEIGFVFDNHVSKEQCKEFIKDGTWIVKSVGEQKPVEAPQSDVEPIVVGSIQIGTGTSLVRIRKLTEAINTLAEAWANLNDVMKKGLGV